MTEDDLYQRFKPKITKEEAVRLFKIGEGTEDIAHLANSSVAWVEHVLRKSLWKNDSNNS